MSVAKKLKIAMIAAEIAPFVKVGGLADVVGSLPPVIKKLGADVILIMPLYGAINRRKYNLTIPASPKRYWFCCINAENPVVFKYNCFCKGYTVYGGGQVYNHTSTTNNTSV